MRNILYLVLIVLGSKLNAQNIYPNGAKWYYNQPSIFSPDINFSTLEVIGDTVINSIPCKKLNKLSGCDFLSGLVFIYSDSNKVYFFNSSLQSFKLLYDFNANSGDSWVVYPESPSLDSLTISVDSTSTEIINGNTVKVLYTTNSSSPGCFGIGGKIIEKIGSVGYFFPQYCICDPSSGPLRCYSDSSIGLYETGIADSCDQIILGINEIKAYNNIGVFPNPAFDYVYIHFSKSFENKKYTLILSDASGRIWKTEINKFSFEPYYLNIKSFEAGFY